MTMKRSCSKEHACVVECGCPLPLSFQCPCAFASSHPRVQTHKITKRTQFRPFPSFHKSSALNGKLTVTAKLTLKTDRTKTETDRFFHRTGSGLIHRHTHDCHSWISNSRISSPFNVIQSNSSLFKGAGGTVFRFNFSTRRSPEGLPRSRWLRK